METGTLDAASVILARDGAGGLEIYLARRALGKGHLPGFYVFPGGVVEENDRRAGIGPDGEFAVAAVRETFEEAGIFLGARNGAPRRIPGPERARYYLENLNSAACSGVKTLVPYARWMTPRTEIRRFDTRFFVAEPPCGAEPEPDGEETDLGLWTAPQGALERHAERSLPLLPPTVMLLHSLCRFAGIADLLKAGGRGADIPVLPEPFAHAGELGVLLPCDPDYSILEYKRAPAPGEPSRVVWDKGRWIPKAVL
jgi:8-oxo-dGTP pyrophosphatase MutT (NUDIX family)